MRSSLVVLAPLFVVACAHASSGEPIRVRPGEHVDLTGVNLHEHPIIIELRAGDVLPFDISVEGDLVASPEGASIPLTVKRPFFLRIDDKGLKTSVDGHTFDAKPRAPGTFSLGIGATSAGTRAHLKIKTPEH